LTRGHTRIEEETVRADGLKLGSGDHDSNRRLALEVKESIEGGTDVLDISSGDTKGSGGEANLLDEVADFESVKLHELVHLVHTCDSFVRRVSSTHRLRLLRASEKGAEVLIEMGQQEVL
jgi:hypothetical protein